MQNGHSMVLVILQRDGAALYGLLYRLTLRHEVAEDLLQELFLKLRQVKHAPPIQNPTAYARRMALNLAFDWRRRQVPTVTLEQLGQEPEAAGESGETVAIRRERWAQILQVLGELGEASGMGEAVWWRFVEGESYETIGRLMDKTPHQVRALCHKGVEVLRAKLGDRMKESSRAGK